MPPATATSQPLCLLLALLLVRTGALKFSFSAFYPVTPNMTYQGDAFASGDGVIQLTKNELGRDLRKSWGRAVHLNPVHLWDSATGNLTSFSTRFSFYVGNPPGVNNPGDGLAFFLAPNGSSAPSNSAGGMLALFNVTPPSTATASIPTVAVEFDTYGNSWDPYAVHAGIDVNSVVSVVNVTWQGYGRWSNATVQASVDYDASATNMSVALSGDDGTYRTLHHIVDLREVLPEWVEVGFSATTGASVEIHKIESWSFQSTLEDVTPPSPPTLPPPPLLPPISPPPPPPPQGNERTNRLPVMVGALAGTGTLAVVAGILWFCVWRGRAGGGTEDVPVHERISQDEEMGADVDGIDDREFDGESRGPKRIPYSELARATRDFTDEGKLGEGGFGSVYKGFLRGPGLEVAVKKVSKSSKQGKKEFAAEIKIISRLRHRNLVQLVGWCHDRGDLLLVYEYMPNGSLDRHLYPRDGDGKPPPPPPPLTWEVRRRVSLGLASALFYLHEEWEQCVVHRDVKPSNVMLDAGFNARLGDFGLARLADHDRGLQTTVLAGTMGYIAPECITSGRASKESDVYSFGVLALEIACGRRAIESLAPPGEVGLVDWVWGLYGKGAILEAADKRLDADFNELEMERLMLVGLWCAHPDFAKRPSMRQVMSALNFEAPPPELAAAMPVPTYYEPPAPGKQTSFQVSSAMSAAGVPSSTSSSGGHTATSSSSLDSGKATGSSSATSIPLLPLKKN